MQAKAMATNLRETPSLTTTKQRVDTADHKNLGTYSQCYK